MAEPSKILIIRLSSLGDIILTTPIVRAIKKKYPDAAIDFLLRTEYKDIFKFSPDINQIIEFTRQKDNLAIVSLLKAKKYNLIIDLQNNIRSRNITNKLKAPKLRFRKKNLAKFMLVSFKLNLFNKITPIPVQYAQYVPIVSLDNEGADLFLPDDIKSELLKDDKLIGICPGSRHFTKMYPVDYQIALCKKFVEKGFKIVLFGGKDDKKICRQIASEVPGIVDLSNDDDLIQTAVNMKNCNLVICNDSGLMHAATALKIPVVAIFGSTVKEFGFAPYMSENLILENNSLTCRPCSHIGKAECPKKHFKCMREITPEMVFNSTINYIKTL